MNPFVSRLKGHSWELPVSAMCLVLGVMISLAFINERTRHERTLLLDPDQAKRIREGSLDLQDSYSKLSVEVTKLREDNTKLQNAMASRNNQSKVLNDSLQESKLFAGLTDVEGPGVTVTLTDSQKENTAFAQIDRIIHDVDVLKVVNELWASGAEAIEVNGHRVVGSTSFRCVGPVIHVDGVPIASPVKVRAIGDPKTLEGGLNLPGGVLEELRQLDPEMVKMEAVQNHHFKAYSGPTTKRLLTVPKDKP